MSEIHKHAWKKTIEKLMHTLVKNEKKIYISLGAIALILWLSLAFNFINLKKFLAFTIFVIVGGAFKYFISRFRIFFELTPITFFAVIIAKYMGILWVPIYLLVADVLPSFLGHHGPDHDAFPHWTWVFIFSIAMIPFDLMNTFVQIIAPLVYFLGCLFIEKVLLGGLNGMRWTSSIINLLINFYFFVRFTEFFVGLMI